MKCPDGIRNWQTSANQSRKARLAEHEHLLKRKANAAPQFQQKLHDYKRHLQMGNWTSRTIISAFLVHQILSRRQWLSGRRFWKRGGKDKWFLVQFLAGRPSEKEGMSSAITYWCGESQSGNVFGRWMLSRSRLSRKITATEGNSN